MRAVLMALLLAGLAGAACAETIRARFAPGAPVAIVAHRANGFGAPENSLAGIEGAIAAGIDMVELDVRVTADGVHILMHDSTFERTTNAAERFPDGPPVPPGPFAVISHIVALYPMEQVRALRLKGAADDTREHVVPTLEEALRLAQGRILIDLDVKEHRMDTLAPLIDRYGADNLLVRHPQAAVVARLAEGTGAAPLFHLDGNDPVARLDALWRSHGERLHVVSVAPSRITPALRKAAADKGVRLWVNGLGAPDRALAQGDDAPWQAVLSSRAGAYQTDHPLPLRALLEAGR